MVTARTDSGYCTYKLLWSKKNCIVPHALYTQYTGLFKMIVGVQLSSGNSAPNSGNIHHLTIPFEGGMHSFKRLECVCTPELKVRIRTAIATITADMLQTVWNELDYRVDVCRITKGSHIGHL